MRFPAKLIPKQCFQFAGVCLNLFFLLYNKLYITWYVGLGFLCSICVFLHGHLMGVRLTPEHETIFWNCCFRISCMKSTRLEVNKFIFKLTVRWSSTSRFPPVFADGFHLDLLRSSEVKQPCTLLIDRGFPIFPGTSGNYSFHLLLHEMLSLRVFLEMIPDFFQWHKLRICYLFQWFLLFLYSFHNSEVVFTFWNFPLKIRLRDIGAILTKFQIYQKIVL